MINNSFPFNEDAERCVIAAMLKDSEILSNNLNELTEDDFYNDIYKNMFVGMKNLYEDGNDRIDIVLLSNYFKHDESQVGGLENIVRVENSLDTTAFNDRHVQALKKDTTLRTIIKIGEKIADEARGDVTNLNDFIDTVEQEVLQITRARTTEGFVDVNQVVDWISQRVSMLYNKGDALSGVNTGFRDLDKITSGFQKGDLIILAARPSMGKTAFALNVAANSALDSELPVAIFSLEMPYGQLGQRILSSLSGIDGKELQTGKILDNQPKFYSAIDKMKRCNLYIDDQPGIKIHDIIAKCRDLKNQHGLKLVLIDYLQLITTNRRNAGENRQQEVSDISRQLKALARELEVPVIALSQLSRSVESRTDKRPMLSDLRESGAIEQDADIVSFIYRPDYYKPAEEQGKEDASGTELIIAKHRNGATGTVNLVFQKNFSRFSNANKVQSEDGRI